MRMRIWLLVIGLLCGTANADDFPNRTIKLIVPFAAGGSSDAVSRVIAQRMAASLGQSVVVENRAGAGGNIGADFVAKSKPDGYTLLFAAGSFAINVALYSKLPFDPVKDFEPVALICTVTGILVAHPSVPASSVQELIAIARAQPGRVNYASAGSGTVGHLAGELFKMTTKVDMTHVPYKGSNPALADLIGGQVQVMFANMPGTLQHVKAGRLRVLAVTTEQRSALLPDVPTIAESGLPGYKAATWFGVFAPAGTPRSIVARLNAEFEKALASEAVVELMKSEGAQPMGGPPERLRDFLRGEIDLWTPVVRASGAKAD
jgi:tripartite-type tricarboxylate transporter receptor subunit TctC